MIPAFELFGKTFAIYPLMALLGIFGAGLYICRNTRRRGLDVNDMLIFLLICGVGVLFGMHLLYGLTNIPLLLDLARTPGSIQSFSDFWNAVLAIFGGSVFYGGLLGGIAVGLWYGRKKRLDLSLWSDLITPGIPLFHAFGRVGCFLGGCCYGVACQIGFRYRYSPLLEANGPTRFPIQLVEAGCNLILFFVLDRLLKKGRCKGRLLCVYLLCYAPVRFILEFWRGDALRGIWWGLSTSQWISLLVIVCVSIFLIKDCRRRAV